MKKLLLITVMFVMVALQTVFAGQLGQNDYGFYYVQDDGTLAKSKWITMDIDADGKEEYYYFNEAGLMVVNAKTPDGYDVNEKGQWVKDGKVQLKSNATSNYNSSSSLSGIYNNAYNSTMDAYNKGLDAGQKAVEAGIDAGQKAVEAGIDAVGDMYGGILKGAANEYKKEYNKAVDEYKSEYNKAMNDYKREFNSTMNQYKNALGNLGSLGSFGW